MIIYGVALLAFCFLTGNYIGDILGALLGVKANVGGVGFAMLLLIILTNKGIDAGWLDKKGQEGIAFWSAMSGTAAAGNAAVSTDFHYAGDHAGDDTDGDRS